MSNFIVLKRAKFSLFACRNFNFFPLFLMVGPLILLSCTRLSWARANSFHVVFNRPVNWDRNLHIVCWVAMMSQIKSLIMYALMQGIKESSTLRIGPKGHKPRPRIIYRWGKQDGQIKKYLRERRKINKIAEDLRARASC